MLFATFGSNLQYKLLFGIRPAIIGLISYVIYKLERQPSKILYVAIMVLAFCGVLFLHIHPIVAIILCNCRYHSDFHGKCCTFGMAKTQHKRRVMDLGNLIELALVSQIGSFFVWRICYDSHYDERVDDKIGQRLLN